MPRGKSKSRNWHVATARWGDEFVAQRSLTADGFEVYLPLRRLSPTRSRRHRRVAPLLDGYVFVRESDRWQHVPRSRGVVGVMHAEGIPLIATDGEIRRLRDLEDDLGYCSVTSADWVRRGLAPGVVSSPLRGPWQGQLGRILEMDRASCSMSFSMMGRDVRVRVRTSDLVG